MTINPTEYTAQGYEEAPLTPRNDGKVQFLGPDTVRYISPPRIEIPRQRVRPVAPQPPQTSGYSSISPPPSYQSSMYSAPPPPPQMVQMMAPQYMMPGMPHHPQMMCMPTMQQTVMAAPVMSAPVMTQMAQMVSPVQLSPPQVVQPSPTITLCINQSPQSNGSPGGSGALVCPKCRKGIITRQQDKFRRRLLICLAFCCCPLTCGLPLICICCNYVDTCGACGKGYGHRGRKNYKTKVNAVKL